MMKTTLPGWFLLAALLAPAAQAQFSPSPAGATLHKVKRGGDTKIQAENGSFDPLTRTIVYVGHVHIDNPDLNLRCAKMTSYSPSGDGHPNRIVAESSAAQPLVSIDMLDDKGQTNHVTGKLAVYEYKVTNGVTNETVTVTGDPHLDTSMMYGTADKLVWDRMTGRMSASNPDFTTKDRANGLLNGTNAPPAAPTNTPPTP